MGCQVLRLGERPAALATRQALAAIGQGSLMRLYTDFFAALSTVRSTNPAKLGVCEDNMMRLP